MRYRSSLLAASMLVVAAGCVGQDPDEVAVTASQLGNYPEPSTVIQVTDGHGVCWDSPPGQSWLQGLNCNAGSNQLWTFEPINPTYFRIHSVADPSRCLDIPSGNASSGQELQLYPCHDGPNQQWSVTPQDANFAVIKSTLSSNLCVDVQQGVNPTKLQLYSCHGGFNQAFRFRSLLGTGTTKACPGNLIFGSSANTVFPGAIVNFAVPTTVSITCNALPPTVSPSTCSSLTNWMVVNRGGGTGPATYQCLRQ